MNKKNSKIFVSENFKKFFSYFSVLIIFAFLSKNILQNWNQIKQLNLNFNIYNFLLITILSLLLHFLNSISWHLLTKAVGLKIKFAENLRIWMLPNLSRYVPGVVWQYVGRAYLLSKKGVSKSQSTLVMLLDAIFTFSIGAFVVLLTTLVFKFQIGSGYQWILFCILPLPIIIVFLFSNQRLIKFILKTLMRITHRNYDLPSQGFSYIWLVLSSLVTFVQFLVAGGVIYLIANELYKIPFSHLPVFGGIYAASWILGYVSFFAPGGLGVQELSMAGLLSIIIPFPIASLVSVLFRFALVISELTVSLVTLWLSKKDLKIQRKLS